jgi:hypothetical protein
VALKNIKPIKDMINVYAATINTTLLMLNLRDLAPDALWPGTMRIKKLLNFFNESIFIWKKSKEINHKKVN